MSDATIIRRMTRDFSYTDVDRKFFSQLKKNMTSRKALTYLDVIDCGKSIQDVGGVYVDFFNQQSLFSSKDKMELSIQDVDLCVNAIKYMRLVNGEVFKISSRDRCSKDSALKKYLSDEIETEWRKRNHFSVRDVQKLYAPPKRTKSSRPQDFMQGLEKGISFDFNKSWQTENACSSDYWKEAAAGHIEIFDCDYEGSILSDMSAGLRYTMLMQELANCPMPQLMYPNYYDFVCGRPVKKTCHIDFKFVAKYLDCSPEGLMKVARHYLDFFVRFDTNGVKIQRFFDQAKISNIRFEQKDYMDVCNEIDNEEFPNDSLIYEETRYFDDDMDSVYDEVQRCDVPHMTFVYFRYTFQMSVCLLKPLMPSKNQSGYFRGVEICSWSKNLLQRMRDIFESPLNFCVDHEVVRLRQRWWLLKDPTVERFKEYRFRSLLRNADSIESVAEVLYDYGGDKARSALFPIIAPRRHVYDPRRYHHVFMGNLVMDVGFKEVDDFLGRVIDCLNSYKEGMRCLLNQWDEISTPSRFYQKVASAIRVDPVMYADSQVPFVAEYARNFL